LLQNIDRHYRDAVAIAVRLPSATHAIVPAAKPTVNHAQAFSPYYKGFGLDLFTTEIRLLYYHHQHL
jgi:hypothetical protein